MSDKSPVHRKRAPAGVVKRPLNVYLLPDELEAFDRLHEKSQFTRSALGRLVHLAGMKQLANDPDGVLQPES